jgi:hypothetical protein
MKPEQYLFEYAVIRVVPQVEREEFLNAGVVLYCAKKKFLKMKFFLNENKLACFAGETDVSEINTYLHAFEMICTGGKNASLIADLPAAERFRWLTATRSTVIQTSKVHPGFCTDPDEKLLSLFSQLVG